jgi:hypothetical protein
MNAIRARHHYAIRPIPSKTALGHEHLMADADRGALLAEVDRLEALIRALEAFLPEGLEIDDTGNVSAKISPSRKTTETKGPPMPIYLATVQVTTEYQIPVQAKDEEAAYDKVQNHIDKDTWKKYAVDADDVEPDVSLLEVNDADLDTDEFERWVR